MTKILDDTPTNGDTGKDRNAHVLAPQKNTPVQGYHEFIPAQPYPIGGILPAERFPQNASPPKVFEPLTIRGTTFHNRLWVAPMCQYSSDDGHATDFHFVHIGSMATRGWGNIMVEATAVVPEGRISPEDAGLWQDSQIAPLKRQVDFVHAHKGKIGIQLAHAGRKASTQAPFVRRLAEQSGWTGGRVPDAEAGGWADDVVGPSAISFEPKTFAHPLEASAEYIENLKQAWVDATRRAKEIGFDFIEIHGAHGYLFHEFVDPISNIRTDKYGGSLENRLRLPLEVAKAIRAEWDGPLLYRLSASDWLEPVLGPEKQGDEWKWWGIEQTTIFTQKLADLGVDLIDVSSGGNDPRQQIKVGPSYQVHFAEHVKKHVKNILVGTVGIITDAVQANDILENGQADVVFFAREVLRNVDFPLKAAEVLGAAVAPIIQYELAWSRMVVKRDHLNAGAHHAARSEVEGEEGRESRRKAGKEVFHSIP